MPHLDPGKIYQDYGEGDGPEPVFLRVVDGARVVIRCRDEARRWASCSDESKSLYENNSEFKRDMDRLSFFLSSKSYWEENR